MSTRARSTASRSSESPSQGQSLRSELKRITRERLTESAIELFTNKGYRATSVKDIADAAGTTPTTFYRYFKGKSELARLLQDRINIEVKKTLDALDEIKRPSRKAIRAWMDEYNQMWQKIHVLCESYWEATRSEPALAAELVPITFELVESMKLLEKMPKGRTRDSFKTRLVIMYILMDRFMYLVNIQDNSDIVEQMQDEFADILWYGLSRAKTSS